jgi:drug/metabolite transporter (DMT)-like permease
VKAGTASSRNPAHGYLLVAVGAALFAMGGNLARCVVAALRHLPAPRVAVAATLEPVLAALFVWWLHDERLALVQLAGGGLVLAAVLWVQERRPDLEAELAPPLREAR